MSFVQENPTIQVPGHLSNVSPEKKNYKYAHSYPGNWVEQDYLPKDVKARFYKAQQNGSERALSEQHAQLTKKK
jgi:putative ATPase